MRGAACLLAVFLTLTACSREPDEQALRRSLAAMESAIESGATADFLAHIEDGFSGQDGAIDRQQLRALLLGYRLRYRDISLTLGPAKVQLFDGRASVQVEVLARGGAFLPEAGQLITIQSHWRRTGNDWRCFSASWSGRF